MTNTPTHHHFKFLLSILSFILICHAAHLPSWIVAISLLFGLWRLGISLNKFKPPTLTVLAPLTIMIGVGILLTFSGQINSESGVAMLVVMLWLKLLETKTKRDYIIIILTHYLVVGCLFLFNQSLVSFIASLIGTCLLTAALIQINLKQLTYPSTLIKQSLILLIQATPFMLVLFVLFPRPSGPLWGSTQLSQAKTNLPGLSNRIQLNQMGQNAQDSSVAFRVQFAKAFPPNAKLYWRGPVLWVVKGDQWSTFTAQNRLSNEVMSMKGQADEYSVTLEPNNHQWLLMLDMPATAPEQGSFTKDRSIQSHTSNQTRIVYRGRSYTDYQLGTLDKLPKRTLQAALQLDYHANPKTVALAKQWRNQSKLQIVNNALAFYRHHGFSYTLNPPVASQHAIDHFLFESKRGFCEHFATSFVYMMRAAGVPARVVTGYQGGERNGKYLIVRQSDAHAWAEVWLERQGWIRIDPTASIAPERIRFGIAEAIEKISENQTTSIKHSNNHQLPLTLRVKQYPLLHQASLMWDRAEHQWNQSIISYNYRQQQSWLSSWSHQAINQKMMLIVLILTVLLMLAIAIFIIVKNNKTQPNQAQKLYLEFLNKLAPYQLKQDAHESVLDFAIRASQQLPQAQAQILAIARMYNLLEYSRLDSIEKKALNQSFKKIVQTFSLKSSRSK